MINIMNSVSQIMITRVSLISDAPVVRANCPRMGQTKKKTSALLTQAPSRRVLVLHLGQIDIPGHTISCGTARSTNGGGVGGGGRPS